MKIILLKIKNVLTCLKNIINNIKPNTIITSETITKTEANKPSVRSFIF